VRGELVGLGRSGHLVLCQVLAMINRLGHFQLHRAPPHLPLYSYHNGSQWHHITTTTLTQHLQWAALALTTTRGISPEDISIRSLRSSGAMALLCANEHPDKIWLLGRWRSDEMLRYLHVLPHGPPWTPSFHSKQQIGGRGAACLAGAKVLIANTVLCHTSRSSFF
jgi:hypothetical protein